MRLRGGSRLLHARRRLLDLGARLALRSPLRHVRSSRAAGGRSLVCAACPTPRKSASWGAASGCCRASTACACRCPGRASRTATPGRWRPGDGFVLVDTGMHQEGSLANLERALDMCDLRLEDCKLVVCTHAHSDHCGQAATIVERAGCELWMHPSHELMSRMSRTPRRCGRGAWRWPGRAASPRSRCAATPNERGTPEPGIAGPIEVDRDLVAGVVVRHRPGRMGDLRDARPLALARVPVPARAASADLRRPPAGAHLAVLRVRLLAQPGGGVPATRSDVVERLGARLCLAGHGRTFTDVHAHIHGNRALVRGAPGQGARRRRRAAADRRSRSSRRCTGTRCRRRTRTGCCRRRSATSPTSRAPARAQRIAGEPERWAA